MNDSTNKSRAKKVNTQTAKAPAKKKRKNMDDIVRKSFKRTSGFMFRLLVNLIIIAIVVNLFSYSFHFAYSVFKDVAKDPDSTEYVIVEIPADSTVINIGEALEDAGVIENKYVFYVKINLKQYAANIQSGKYGLSPSMTFQDIVDIICDFDEDENLEE